MKMLITGATGGLGSAIANLAAATVPGASLALVDCEGTPLEALAEDLRAQGAQCVTVTADLGDSAQAVEAATIAVDQLAGLDALISNAGIAGGAPLEDLEVSDFERVFAINTRATWLLAKTAREALARSHGAIVATTSISARFPTPPLGAYSASKAALRMLVQQMALEWGPAGIRANCVAPGPTDTGMTFHAFGDMDDPSAVANRRHRESLIPLRKVGAARDIAEAVLFLASPRAGQITGVELAIDGGLSVGLMPISGGGSGHALGAAS